MQSSPSCCLNLHRVASVKSIFNPLLVFQFGDQLIHECIIKLDEKRNCGNACGSRTPSRKASIDRGLATADTFNGFLSVPRGSSQLSTKFMGNRKKFVPVLVVAPILVGVLLGSSIAKADALFTKDLYFGIQGDPEVTKLQEFLTDQGVYSGPVTGNFFSLTLAGVRSLQSREGIAPAAGYFGPLTRARTNELLGQQLSASEQQAVLETGSPPASPVPPATTGDVVSSLQSQISLLLQQVQLLQQQLATQQQTQQTLQQIQQNTAPPAPVPPPSPSDTISPVITAVQAANITTNAAVISWTTNEYSDGVAYLGLSPGSYFSMKQGSVTAASTGYLHTVNLSSLSPDTTYYYKVTSTDSSGNKGTSSEYPFATAQIPPPPPPSPGVITASRNSSVGSISVLNNSTNVRIGSYAIAASTASAVTLNDITITVGSGSAAFHSLKVLVGGLQFGATQSAVTNGSAYSFSGTPFSVPKGGTTYVDVYADIVNVSFISPATILSGCSGTGVDANNAVSCNTVNGQNMVLATIPAVSTASAGTQLFSGANDLIQFTVTNKSSNTQLSWNVVSFNVTTAAATAPFFRASGAFDPAATFTIRDLTNSYNLTLGTTATAGSAAAGQYTIYLPTEEVIAAGGSRQYRITGSVIAPASNASISTQLVLRADAVTAGIKSGVAWRSAVGNADTGVDTVVDPSDSGFVWSDNSSTAHSLTSTDWANGVYVDTFPSSSHYRANY